MLFIRFVGLLIALIEAVLALRLLFPLMRIPKSMDGYVPMLTSISDWLMAPFQSIVRPFRLEGLEGLPGGADLGYVDYLNQLDTSVLVAMVGWAIIGALVLFILRVVLRPR